MLASHGRSLYPRDNIIDKSGQIFRWVRPHKFPRHPCGYQCGISLCHGPTDLQIPGDRRVMAPAGARAVRGGDPPQKLCFAPHLEFSATVQRGHRTDTRRFIDRVGPADDPRGAGRRHYPAGHPHVPQVSSRREENSPLRHQCLESDRIAGRNDLYRSFLGMRVISQRREKWCSRHRLCGYWPSRRSLLDGPVTAGDPSSTQSPLPGKRY